MTDQGSVFDVRRAGVLLHVTSLPPASPGEEAGQLGDGAHRFVDFLNAAGCSVWQVLPLVPTHEETHSPYDAPSSMAGNPALISSAHRSGRSLDDRSALDDGQRSAFAAWCAERRDWLEPYVEFTALRALHSNAPWLTWSPALRDRQPGAVSEALRPLADRVEDLRFEQWVFA